MIKGRAAFTIVELVIAVAVLVLVFAISVPRFADFARSQETARAVQDIVACIQKGQQEAAAPTVKETGFVGVTLRDEDNKLSCSASAYRPTKDGNALSEDNFKNADMASLKTWDGPSVSNLLIDKASSSMEGFGIRPNLDMMRIYFDVAKGGVPVVACTPTMCVRDNGGFSATIEIRDNSTTADQKGVLAGTINVGTLGQPIIYQAN